MKNELLTELGQYLVEGSLTDRNVLQQTGLEPSIPILPDANVLKVGVKVLSTAAGPRCFRSLTKSWKTSAATT